MRPSTGAFLRFGEDGLDGGARVVDDRRVAGGDGLEREHVVQRRQQLGALGGGVGRQPRDLAAQPGGAGRGLLLCLRALEGHELIGKCIREPRGPRRVLIGGGDRDDVRIRVERCGDLAREVADALGRVECGLHELADRRRGDEQQVRRGHPRGILGVLGRARVDQGLEIRLADEDARLAVYCFVLVAATANEMPAPTTIATDHHPPALFERLQAHRRAPTGAPADRPGTLTLISPS